MCGESKGREGMERKAAGGRGMKWVRRVVEAVLGQALGRVAWGICWGVIRDLPSLGATLAGHLD